MDTPGTSSQYPENQPNNENVEDEPHETGVYWTPELNIEFIRMRKHYGDLIGKGKRRGMPMEGWERVIAAMGLQGKLTALQAKKRWENFMAKYKSEKYPTRFGKPRDTPITWPLYNIMDWAVGDKRENKPTASTSAAAATATATATSSAANAAPAAPAAPAARAPATSLIIAASNAAVAFDRPNYEPQASTSTAPPPYFPPRASRPYPPPPYAYPPPPLANPPPPPRANPPPPPPANNAGGDPPPLPRIGRNHLFGQFQIGLRNYMEQMYPTGQQPEVEFVREPEIQSTVRMLLGNAIHVLTQSVQNRGHPFPEVYDVRLRPGRRFTQEVIGECENNANTIQESLSELNELMNCRLSELEARQNLGSRTMWCLRELLSTSSRQANALVRLTDILEDIPLDEPLENIIV